MTCCAAFVRYDQKSPLSRIIAVDIYDGPLAGVAECRECRRPYSFHMEAWDRDQAIRVFTLAPLPEGSFDEALASFSDAGQPTWPEWWPSTFSSDRHREYAWRRANEIMASAGPPECVVIAESLGGPPIAVLQIDTPEKGANLSRLQEAKAPFDEWHGFVNQGARQS